MLVIAVQLPLSSYALVVSSMVVTCTPCRSLGTVAVAVRLGFDSAVVI